jgi:homoserine kinase
LFNYAIKKGFIKYEKNNGIIPMKTHVDNVHPCLFTKRKFVLSERAMAMHSKIDHNWQHEKKKVGATSYAITFFWGVNALVQECQ